MFHTKSNIRATSPLPLFSMEGLLPCTAQCKLQLFHLYREKLGCLCYFEYWCWGTRLWDMVPWLEYKAITIFLAEVVMKEEDYLSASSYPCFALVSSRFQVNHRCFLNIKYGIRWLYIQFSRLQGIIVNWQPLSFILCWVVRIIPQLLRNASV